MIDNQSNQSRISWGLEHYLSPGTADGRDPNGRPRRAEGAALARLSSVSVYNLLHVLPLSPSHQVPLALVPL